jgi:TRAP-type C4-dicarboxylate transport system substrate-binding protein
MKHVGAALLLVSSLLAAGRAGATEVIKLGTLAPEGSPWYDITRDMADAWKELSKGRIEVRIYAGGIAGDEDIVIRKMRVGQLHAAALSAGGLADLAPEFRALALPMLIRSYDELDYVLERKRSEFEALLEAKGFKVLNWADAGWLHFFSQRPVVRPDDLRPQRLFWWEAGGAYVEAWRDEGFQPVPLAATHMHAALQSGLINAFLAPAIAALSFQWFALAPHMSDLDWAPLIGATVITAAAWEQVPDDLKPAFLDAARSAAARMKDAVRAIERQAIEVMQQHGLAVHHLSAEDVAVWQQAAESVYPRLVGHSVPAAAAEDVRRLVGAFRAGRDAR